MKKILFVLTLIFTFAMMNVKAQTLSSFTGTDTVVNTATVNLTLGVRGAYDYCAFQVVNTKVSGTPAGTTVLQYSVDGINYVTSTTVGDTLTNTNQTTNTKIWTLTDPKYPYYRLKTTGSGTMSVITSAKAHFKKK